MRGIQRLYQFVAVAEELHFGRAAKRLHMTQPPLSMQIRTLEQDIGVALLLRTKRHVELTEAGKVLLVEARRVMDQVARAVTLTQRAGRGEIGSLRIGFVSTADYSLLPTLLRKFRRCYPDVDLTLKELTTDAQLHALAQGDLDICFLLAPVDDDDISSETVFREPLIAALPDTHALARTTGELSVQALNGEGFIIFPRTAAPIHYDKILALTAAAGFSPRIEQTAVQMQTIVSLVSAGLGVALVPACMRNLARFGVVYRDLEPPTAIFETAIAWPKHHLTEVGANFVALTRAVLDAT